MFKNFILPVSLLAGAIIGAGMFSLPYVFDEAGFNLGWVYLAALTAVMIFIHLLYGDIVLRTGGEHNFVGYAKIYLGDWWARLAVWMSVIEMIVVLVIYLILSVSFLGLILSPDKLLSGAIVFWFLGSAVVFWNLKKMALLDFFIDLGMILIVFALFLKGWAAGIGGEIFQSLDTAQGLKNLFLPIGPILFALSGRVAVLETIKYFLPERPVLKIKRAIIWGTLIPAVVYGLFVIGVASLADPITKDAISGLANVLPLGFMALVGILGIASLWTSYVAIGFDIFNILRVDLRLNKALASLAVVALPVIFYLAGFDDFIFLISLVGGIFIALEGLLILWIWFRMDKISSEKPKLLRQPARFLTFFLILVFSIAFFNEIVKLI